MRGEADLREVLDGLCLHQRLYQGSSVGEQPMIGKKDGVVGWEEWLEALTDLFGAGGGIRSKRNKASGHEDFGADGLIESFSTGGEGSCNRRVGVDDRLYVRAAAVDRQMHADLTGDGTLT